MYFYLADLTTVAKHVALNKCLSEWLLFNVKLANA
jgi:hypothetical protein